MTKLYRPTTHHNERPTEIRPLHSFPICRTSFFINCYPSFQYFLPFSTSISLSTSSHSSRSDYQPFVICLLDTCLTSVPYSFHIIPSIRQLTPFQCLDIPTFLPQYPSNTGMPLSRVFFVFFLSFQSHRLNRIPPFFVYLPTSFSSPRVHNSHHLFCYHSSRPFTVFLLVIFYLYLIKTSVYFPNMEYSIHFDGCTKFLFIIVLFYFIHQTFT